MLILDGLRNVRKKGRLLITKYQRGHLSLKSGTKLWICFVPGGNPDSVPEVFASTINYKAWDSIARVTASFDDRPGVVNHLLTVIRSLNVNIVFEESASINCHQNHIVELVVDMSDITGGEPSSLDEKAQRLRDHIVALCIDDLCVRGDRANCRVEPMWCHHEFKKRYNKEASREYSDGIAPIQTDTQIESGYMLLPPTIEAAVRRRCGYGPKQKIKYTTVSSTEDRALRIHFQHSKAPIMLARVAHEDAVGALANISSRIAREFTMQCSLS